MEKKKTKYKYAFERIDLKYGLTKKTPKQDYREVINNYAMKGWKFKQIYAPSTLGYGPSGYFELIFEKEI